MRILHASLAIATLALAVHQAQGKESSSARVKSAATRQAAPVIRILPAEEATAGEVELPQPTADVPAAVDQGQAQTNADPLATENILRGKGIPASPYPAGLSYVMTPQPFRVPYPDRIYYPPKHYVHLCPYYPRGVYWGADWNKRLLGCNPWLIHGDKRFNPYLTAAKIRHHSGGRMTAGGPAACPHCGQVHSLASHTRMTEQASPAASRSMEVVKMPQPPEANSIAPELSDLPAAQPTLESSARPDSAAKATRTARNVLPPWQRPPAVRR